MAFMVASDGARIYYETFGSKASAEKILLMSGAGFDSSYWKYQIEYLQKDFYIIAVDHRGTGKSDCPDYSYSAQMMALDIKDILQKERIERINFAGYSLGGLVGQKFTNDYPEKVKRLILLNCSLGAGNPDIVLPSQEVINMFLFSPVLTSEDIVKNALEYSFGKLIEQEYPNLYKVHFERIMKNIKGIPHQIPIMLSGTPLIEDYTKLNMPTLCILSNQDPIIPPENGRIFKKYLPHARIEYLEGPHASKLIHPKKVSYLIEDFIRNNPDSL